MAHDFIDKALDVLNSGEEVDYINHVYVALIPKKEKCEFSADFRTISICNILYKNNFESGGKSS